MDTSIEAWCSGVSSFGRDRQLPKTIHGLLTWQETGGDNRATREML